MKVAEPIPSLQTPAKVSHADSTMNRCSNELFDLVTYMNVSHRVGRGGLLWCGCNAMHWGESSSKARTTSPTAGAHLVLVSTEGARFRLDKREQIPNMHMRNCLANCCGPKWQEDLGAAYIEPSIGSYREHESSTSPGQMLMSHFNAKCVHEGTRPMKTSDRLPYICAFTETGPA